MIKSKARPPHVCVCHLSRITTPHQLNTVKHNPIQVVSFVCAPGGLVACWPTWSHRSRIHAAAGCNLQRTWFDRSCGGALCTYISYIYNFERFWKYISVSHNFSIVGHWSAPECSQHLVVFWGEELPLNIISYNCIRARPIGQLHIQHAKTPTFLHRSGIRTRRRRSRLDELGLSKVAKLIWLIC